MVALFVVVLLVMVMALVLLDSILVKVRDSYLYMYVCVHKTLVPSSTDSVPPSPLVANYDERLLADCLLSPFSWLHFICLSLNLAVNDRHIALT